MAKSSGHLMELVRTIVVELWRYFANSPHSRFRQLEALRELDDRMLSDVGITREEAKCGKRIPGVTQQERLAMKTDATGKLVDDQNNDGRLADMRNT